MWHAWRKKEKEFLMEKSEKEDYFEALNIDLGITLNWMLSKYDEKGWNGLLWLKVWRSDWAL
jgi:hypothetical protein